MICRGRDGSELNTGRGGGGRGLLAAGSAQADAMSSGSAGGEPSAAGTGRYSQAAFLFLM